MKAKVFSRFVLLSSATLLPLGTVSATTAGVRNWVGTTDSDWTNDANWRNVTSATTAPATDGTYAIRINLNNGANHGLIYSAAQGYTIYTGDGTNRALASSSGSNGSMTITGGTFDSRSSAEDFLGANGGTQTKTLTVDGGHYTNINGGSSTFLISYEGAGSKGVLNVNSGSFTAGIIAFSRSTSHTGIGEINLNGGILQANSFRQSTSTDTTINFNGGILRAGANSTAYIATGINTVAVKAGGALLDTNGFAITIGKALTEDSGSTGGGLTLNDQSTLGTGTLTLSAANTYTGATTVTAGTLALANNLAIQNSALDTTGDGSVTLASGITTPTFGGLSGSRDLSSVITSGYGDVTGLTLNPLSGSVTYGGVISNGAADMTLTKTGAGTQILTGANTYTGATTISAGMLQLGNGGTAGSLSASSAITNNGTLAFKRSDTVTQGTDFASVISGTGGLSQNGAGTLVLSGANTYTGATTVDAGTLVVGVNNIGSITSSVTVNDGGILGGSGTITGSVTINEGGTHNAGNSPGIQTVDGNVTYKAGSIFEWDLAGNVSSETGTRGTHYDGVNISGNLTVESGAIFRVIQNSGLDFADTFWTTNQIWNDIFNVTGTVSGWAANTTVAVFDTSGTLKSVSSFGSFSIDGSTLTWQAVPEPSTALAGLLLTAGLLRRRRKA
jgi:fibronectin-binding autotransporter adhesin